VSGGNGYIDKAAAIGKEALMPREKQSRLIRERMRSGVNPCDALKGMVIAE
jgi:hypothetical protein